MHLVPSSIDTFKARILRNRPFSGLILTWCPPVKEILEDNRVLSTALEAGLLRREAETKIVVRLGISGCLEAYSILLFSCRGGITTTHTRTAAESRTWTTPRTRRINARRHIAARREEEKAIIFISHQVLGLDFLPCLFLYTSFCYSD